MLLEIEAKVYSLVRIWNYVERLSSSPHDLKKAFKHYMSPVPMAFQGSSECFRVKN